MTKEEQSAWDDIWPKAIEGVDVTFYIVTAEGEKGFRMIAYNFVYEGQEYGHSMPYIEEYDSDRNAVGLIRDATRTVKAVITANRRKLKDGVKA